MQWFVFAFAAAIFTSIASVVEKKTLMKEHAMEYSTVFAVLMFLLSFLFLNRVTFDVLPQQWILLVIESTTAAGGFLYIASADLIPELHKETGIFRSVTQFICNLAAILLIFGIISLLR